MYVCMYVQKEIDLCALALVLETSIMTQNAVTYFILLFNILLKQ